MKKLIAPICIVIATIIGYGIGKIEKIEKPKADTVEKLDCTKLDSLDIRVITKTEDEAYKLIDLYKEQQLKENVVLINVE